MILGETLLDFQHLVEIQVIPLRIRNVSPIQTGSLFGLLKSKQKQSLAGVSVTLTLHCIIFFQEIAVVFRVENCLLDCLESLCKLPDDNLVTSSFLLRGIVDHTFIQ